MKQSSRIAGAVMALGVWLAFAPSALADTVISTYNGYITSPAVDYYGLFGSVGQNLSGLPFTAIYTTNTALGEQSSNPEDGLTGVNGGGFSIVNGIRVYGDPVSATLIINGHSQNFPGDLDSIPFDGTTQSQASPFFGGAGFYANDAEFIQGGSGAPIGISNNIVASTIPFGYQNGFSTSGSAGPGPSDGGCYNCFTYLSDNISIVPTSISVSNAASPVLPSTTSGNSFIFNNPVSGAFYDPPSTSGFTYNLTGGDFDVVGAPPVSNGFGPLSVVVNGHVVDVLEPGAFYSFGPNVSSFQLTGISPSVDGSDPSAFPTYLDFSGTPSSLVMSSLGVPEPAAWAVMVIGFGGLGAALRSRRKLAVTTA